MSPVDIEYFDFLMRSSKVPSVDNAEERRLQREQCVRNERYRKEFLKMLGKPTKKELDSVKVAPRTEDAKWHISYFGDMDKKWKEIVMKELGCSNYELYPSIDDCISKWKK